MGKIRHAGIQHLVFLLSTLALCTSIAVGSETRRLAGHVADQAIANSVLIGNKAGSSRLKLAVSLAPRDPEGLKNFLSHLYNPQDPLYHHFLSPAQYKERFAPTDQDVAKVVAYFSQLGLNITHVHDNNHVIDLEGSTTDIQNAFQVQIRDYKAEDGRNVYANTSNPVLSTEMAAKVNAVTGLNSFAKFKPHLVQEKSLSASFGANSTPADYVTPAKIKSAYNLTGVSATGSGETLALFELDNYAASDIKAYASYFGLTAPTLTNVFVDGYNGALGDGQAEVTLDIELAMAIAPGLSKIMVYEGPNSDTGVVDTYSKIATDNIAKEISTSWGEAESVSLQSTLTAENTIFQQMAAQGQSIMAASGDSGAFDDPSAPSTLAVDDPASQPYMTGVGGTSLTLSGNNYGSETTWGSLGINEGGGGGISKLWSIPSWQAGLGTSTNGGSSTMRMVPDVSLEADPSNGYSIYVSGAWNVYGGTSCAAPLWAGFTALVNQTRVAQGLARVGFLNPLLYTVGQSSSYASAFHDISDGSTNGHFAAVKGYDMATGWGSFNGQGLYNALVGNVSASPSPTTTPAPVVTLPAPGNFTVKSVGSVIVASWSSVTGAASYQLLRASSSSGPFSVRASGITTTSYTDVAATSATYYYYVQAVDGDGPGAASASVAVVTGGSTSSPTPAPTATPTPTPAPTAAPTPTPSASAPSIPANFTLTVVSQ